MAGEKEGKTIKNGTPVLAGKSPKSGERKSLNTAKEE